MDSNKLTNLAKVFLAGMVIIHACLAWNSRHLVRLGYPDFTIFYSAAKIVDRGLGSRLYNDEVQYQVQQEFASGVVIRKGALPYNHPPFEVAIFIPLAALPYLAAYLVWDLVNLAILALIPFILRAHIPLLQRHSWGFWLLASLAFFPAAIGLIQGQDVILALLFLSLAYACFKRDSDFVAGCWLAAGLFRYHLILPFALMFLWARKGRAALGFLLVGLCLILLSVFLVGWDGVLSYPSYVFQMERSMAHERMELGRRMPNLRGLAENLTSLAGTTDSRQAGMIALMSVAMFVATLAKARTLRTHSFDLSFALCLVATLLITYHTLVYDTTLLLLPMALVLNFLSEKKSVARSTWIWMVGPILILAFSPLQQMLASQTDRYGWFAIVLLLWWWGIYREASRASYAE